MLAALCATLGRMPQTTIVITQTFEAAHRLPNVPPDHKCARLHGHSYKVELHVTGPVCPKMGWVVDYAQVRAAFAPVWQTLDHHYLNEIAGLENPTSEHIARYIFERVKPQISGLSCVVVHETCCERCVYSA